MPHACVFHHSVRCNALPYSEKSCNSDVANGGSHWPLDSLNSERWCDQVKFSGGGSFFRTMIPFRGSSRTRSVRHSEALYTAVPLWPEKPASPCAQWSEAAPRWPGCFTLYSIACAQTVDDPWAEHAGRHIRAGLFIRRGRRRTHTQSQQIRHDRAVLRHAKVGQNPVHGRLTKSRPRAPGPGGKV